MDVTAILLRLRLEHPAGRANVPQLQLRFGPAVQIYTPMHPMNAELRRKQEFGKPIKIGSDVWVGGGSIICPGVRIGSKTVIGAGSVVTRDIPDGVFAAGNPRRTIPGRRLSPSTGETWVKVEDTLG